MMRDRRLMVLACLLVGILAVAGCSGAGDSTDSEAGQTEPAAAETESKTSAAEGAPKVDVALAKTGWGLLEEKCTVCHPIATVEDARLDWAGWESAVNHMLENGAELSDAEKQAVLEYLGTREQVKLYGASEVQQECMVCHTTDRVNTAVLDWDGWEAAVDHMIANGAKIDTQQRAIIIEYLAVRGPQS